jgi:hypothetical protein
MDRIQMLQVLIQRKGSFASAEEARELTAWKRALFL